MRECSQIAFVPAEGSVEIPLDYFISTHVLLNQSYEKMKEILGESTALMSFSMASDYQPFGPEGISDLDFLGGKVSSLLEKYGYSLKQTRNGNQIEYRLTCPHADKTHPFLGK